MVPELPIQVRQVVSSARMVVKRVANRMPLAATVADYVWFHLRHAWFHSRRPGPGRIMDTRHSDLLAEIRENGFAVLPRYLSPEKCARCVSDFERIVKENGECVQRNSDLRVFGAEEVSETIRAFHDDTFLESLCNQYHRARTINAFTLANKVESLPGSLGSGEGWHKDSSFRQFKAILYLNDVNETCGPFQVIRGSHKLSTYLSDIRLGRLGFRNLRISEEQLTRIIERAPERLHTLTGGPGTLILVDTACIHRGAPPLGGERYALTNYYVERWQIGEPYLAAFRPINSESLRNKCKNWDALRR